MFEAFKIGVQISLMSNAASVLGSIATQLSTVNSHVGTTNAHFTQLEKTMARIKTQTMIGGAMAGAGLFGLSMLKGPLEEAKKFQTETAKFASLGFGDDVTKQAVKFASGMKTIGTSATENLALVSDAMAVFKDIHHAEFAAPIMAKMKFANEAVFGKEGGDANERKFMDMLKVIEFRGGLASEGEFGTQANFVQKVISGSRNRVDAGQLLAALKTGGVALSQRSNEAFYLGSEPLIQEFGGQRYGTGAMSIYQNLVQSRGTITAQQELNRLGLLDSSKIEFNNLGKLKKALPGSFKGSEVLEKEGELALLNKVLLPAFAAKGIIGDDAIIRELGMIIGNRTGSGLMSRIYQQRSTIAMQSAANKNAMGIDDLAATGEKTLAGQEIALHAKWRDVLKELGTSVLPIAIKAAQGLNLVIKGITAFAQTFPSLTAGLVIAFGVLSGLVAAGGVVMVAKAAFTGLGLALSSGGGLSTMLNAAAKSVGGFGAALGKIGLLGGVGLLSYDVATALGADKLGGYLGGKLYDATHDDPGAPKRGFVPKTHGGRSEQPSNIYMDGRKVGEIVSGHQAREMGRPATGPRVFDGSMMPRPVGATGQ